MKSIPQSVKTAVILMFLIVGLYIAAIFAVGFNAQTDEESLLIMQKGFHLLTPLIMMCLIGIRGVYKLQPSAWY